MDAYQILVVFLIGHFIGWVRAHYTIRTEIRKLGKFYVDDEVFECVEITKEKEAQND